MMKLTYIFRRTGEWQIYFNMFLSIFPLYQTDFTPKFRISLFMIQF